MIKEEQSNELLNFSIDHILNRAGQNTCTTITRQSKEKQQQFTNVRRFQDDKEDGARHKIHESNDAMDKSNILFQEYQQYTFQWLNCTRYQPPKLQRIPRKEGIKRRPGRHPRIPFTPFQIEVLESSYKKCPYLNCEEVQRLSITLDLADTRIKIWFQNRRAREKREKTSDPEDVRQN